ncbi:MAG: peptide deformylase [Planctomycetota bacterium]|jgi:peptide deformylase
MLRKIYTYPDPVLRVKSEEVQVIDQELVRLADDMIETMYDANGVGLAAPQVGVNKRLIVIDASETRDKPVVYVNPVIEGFYGEKMLVEEGCLSVPEIHANVERPSQVKVYAQRINGDDYETDADGLLARAFQHEIDHLDGILFIDKISQSEKNSIKDQILYLEQEFEEGKEG